MNDPKYITGPIINSTTGEAIPADEPVFLFRARDVHAVTVLEFYGELINDDPEGDSEHHIAVLRRIEEFYDFRHNKSDRMKQPDTDLGRQGDVIAKRTEETGDVVGSIAARMMKHEDPAVRSMAASLLTQRPDHA